MNMIDKLVEERQEAADAAHVAIKTLIEENDTIDDGDRYQWIMQYGSNMVEVQKLEQVLKLLGTRLPPIIRR